MLAEHDRLDCAYEWSPRPWLGAAFVLREGRKGANIQANSGVIWGMPDEETLNAHVLARP